MPTELRDSIPLQRSRTMDDGSYAAITINSGLLHRSAALQRSMMPSAAKRCSIPESMVPSVPSGPQQLHEKPQAAKLPP
jgi:hypothetical protein